ncbi:MAG: T9SS type A sorting domain-containing protein, partial [Bacteroidota bacterium]|nr:T9SS type A sorting domain-containing protein [Bacteroidota bacterium]
ASFVYQPPSFIKDFQEMPADHYKASEHMANQVGVTIRNNDTLSTGRNVSYGYEVFDDAGASVDSYSGGSATLFPFSQIGYSNVPSHATPLIYPANFTIGFNTFAVGDTGFYTIRHKLIDGARTDSADFRQKFYNYYAYDDGTAEVGYGLYGQYSQLAYKFTMPSAAVLSDTLTAIQMYFLPVLDITNLQQREFTLKVWGDGGNQPGTLLYSKVQQHPEYLFQTPNRFVTYTIDSVILQLSQGQVYYIGWEQQAIDRLYIGFDYNNDHSDKIYYNTTGNWSPSVFDGSLMMRPVFGKPYPIGGDETGIEEPAANGFSVYPNPANDNITIAGLKSGMENINASVFDISGREVILTQTINANGTLDVSELSPGMYFVQLRTMNGESIGTQRVIISR